MNMELSSWLSILAICTLGAMSPGPSIAIIIQITSRSGRGHGLAAAIAHGLGIGCYAFLAVAGLAIAIEQSPFLFNSLKWMGALFLFYLGLNALGVSFPKKSSPINDNEKPIITTQSSKHNSFTIGFLTAFLNPKVAIFFIALFSQFVRPDADLTEKIIMATTASSIDTLWYCFVVIAASQKSVTDRFHGYRNHLQKVFGLLLIAVAIGVVVN